MDFLKDLFAAGALTWEQFADAAKKQGFELVNAAGGAYVPKATADSLTTERDGLRAQLDEANQQIKAFDGVDVAGIKQAAADWEAKYNTDTKALQDKLSAQAYNHAVEKITSAEKFSSAAARKAFLADLTAKELKLDGDKLIGYEEFKKSYQEADPDAFDAAQTPPPYAAWTGTQPITTKFAPEVNAIRAAAGLKTE